MINKFAILLLILLVGCASNQKQYAGEYTQDDYLTDEHSQGKFNDYYLNDEYTPVLTTLIETKKIPNKYLMAGPAIDAKNLINKDGLIYKPKLFIKIFGPGEVFTGKAVHYFMSGLKKSEGTYLNGVKDGEWTYWYEIFGPAMVESKGRYKLGNRDGLWEYWYSNGKKRETGILTNKERNGKWTYYNEDDSLDIIINY